MRRRHVFSLALFSMLGCGSDSGGSTDDAVPPGPVRILALGDSLTLGGPEARGWAEVWLALAGDLPARAACIASESVSFRGERLLIRTDSSLQSPAPFSAPHLARPATEISEIP